MKYAIHQIVLTTEEFGSREFVIIGLSNKGYSAIARKTKKRYILQDDQIAKVEGTVEKNDPILKSLNVADEFAQPNIQPADIPKWKYLSKLSPGTHIKILHRKTIYPAEFVGINSKKPVFILRVKLQGKLMDCRLNALVLPCH